MKIIDTKSDLGFKKVFGEKPHLLMSLLNNLLPLPYPIVSIQYLSPEIVPDIHDGKNSIVDVRCTDNHGRHFIVEMQVGSQLGFIKRVLMNTTKVYSRQLLKNAHFSTSQTVYSLNILDYRFNLDEGEWYHHYAFTNRKNQNDHWEDIQIIMIELPKWKKLGKFDLSNPKDRWLMYFTEPNAFDRHLTQEERDRYNEVYEAMEELKTKNFTPEQLLSYELYIDGVRQYVTTMDLVRQEGIQEGLGKGKEEGRQEGISTSLQIIEALKKQEETPKEIAMRFNTSLDIVMGLQSLIEG